MREHLDFIDGSNLKPLDNPNQFARVRNLLHFKYSMRVKDCLFCRPRNIPGSLQHWSDSEVKIMNVFPYSLPSPSLPPSLPPSLSLSLHLSLSLPLSHSPTPPPSLLLQYPVLSKLAQAVAVLAIYLYLSDYTLSLLVGGFEGELY